MVQLKSYLKKCGAALMMLMLQPLENDLKFELLLRTFYVLV
jgi:hypothetical protein